MKKNTIPTNNLFLELDDIDNFKDLSKLRSRDIVVITTKYHQEINNSLIADFITTIKSENMNYSVGIIEVPGAFELVYAMKKVIDKFSPKLISSKSKRFSRYSLSYFLFSTNESEISSNE